MYHFAKCLEILIMIGKCFMVIRVVGMLYYAVEICQLFILQALVNVTRGKFFLLT